MSSAANSIDVSTIGLVQFNGTEFDSPSISEYYTIVGAADSSIQGVAPGTAGQILTSAGPSALPSYQDAPSGGTVWSSISVDSTAVVGHGYMAEVALTLTLPTAPADGKRVSLVNASDFAISEVVILQAGAGDAMQFGNNQSTVAGTATSSVSGNAVELVYNASQNLWLAIAGVQGTWILA